MNSTYLMLFHWSFPNFVKYLFIFLFNICHLCVLVFHIEYIVDKLNICSIWKYFDEIIFIYLKNIVSTISGLADTLNVFEFFHLLSPMLSWFILAVRSHQDNSCHSGYPTVHLRQNPCLRSEHKSFHQHLSSRRIARFFPEPMLAHLPGLANPKYHPGHLDIPALLARLDPRH